MDQFDENAPAAINPFALAAPAASKGGAVAAMEKREETEVFAMMMLAKRFPRDQQQACDRIMTAFQRPTLAEVAIYQYARGGTSISGPSIRAAEAIAQEWGNLDTGWRELSRGIGANGVPFSEVMAFCVDLQSTNRKVVSFILPHWRDTKGGGYKLKDERDIYELCANQAARRLRACIIANIPGDVIDMAVNQAESTLRAKADTSPEAMARMVAAFAELGVTKEMIEKRIQRSLESIAPAQVVSMKKIYRSLMDDMSTPAEWFDMPDEGPKAGDTTSLSDIAKRGAATPPPPPPAPAAEKPSAGQQGALLDDPKPPAFDDLVKKMQAAKNMDALNTWADWIKHFTDDAQKLRLSEVYEARKAQLDK